jgi:hypothetical protein
MTRTETSIAISKLILMIDNDRKMGLHDYSPAIDYAKRSPEEQKRLFDKGLSKCDGYDKISAHQNGRAFDLLLFREGVYIPEWPEELVTRYHTAWGLMGGKPLISWDQGHFES